ncbi:MAG TPA: FAD-binding protein [Roseiarcus sp.]|nr:FAD-binding protein [Roseiarcus sp.]
MTFAPADAREAAEIVRAAEAPFDIVGGATRGFGRPPAGEARLSSAGLSGVIFHEPAEMTLRARAGTPVREVEARLAAAEQMLPFEPMDPRPLFGTTGEPTVGGLVASGLAGPRRLSAGAVRDNVLGIEFVNGRGEIIRAGGRVTKNVTGLDLVKISCGALGTLGLITEATFKLLPRPRAQSTIVIRRLDDIRATQAMARALGSPFGVSGAATIHAGMGREFPRTLLRVEGFEDSVAYRAERLIALLADFGAKHALIGEDSQRIWQAIRDGAFLAEPTERAVWRASLKPSDAPSALAALGENAHASLIDLGGGLIWFSTDPTPQAAARVRAALGGFPGHAELVRADAGLKARADVFTPLTPALARLTRGVKRSLDPRALFNPGRMYASA